MPGMPPRPHPRRAFLRAAALAPAAIACATARPPPPEGGAAAGTGAAPADAAAEEALRAVREFPLPLEVEPAFVFRALGPGRR
jgi:nitrous oxide reductase